jgi:2-oxoglutarate ferredoxin oxidoreductase subunit beta
MHDGPTIKLKKLERDYDPTNRLAALGLLLEAQEKQEFITGLIYYNEGRQTLPDVMSLDDTPLAEMPAERLRPSREALAAVMAEFD